MNTPLRMPARVIILGAGRPFAGETPSGLRQIDRHRKVLDWILHAFASLKPDVYFVGGYRIGEIMAEYGKLTYVLNERWAETGALASLYAAPLSDDRDHYVCYSDIVFRDAIVLRLGALDPATIGVAADTTFAGRYGGARQVEGQSKEKLRVDGSRVLVAGVAPPGGGVLAEFVGLVRLPRAVMPRVIALKPKVESELGRRHLSTLVEKLRLSGESVQAIEAAGDWSELNSDMDLSRFVFGTKSETLDRLRQRVTRSVVDPQVKFSVARWRKDPQAVIETILDTFDAEQLAVRSSARIEDGFQTAHAGRFQTRLGLARDRDALAAAVEEVIASYDDNVDNQVFVQPMLIDARMSGVIFTRSLNSGAPYYTINFNQGADTASITSGASHDHHTLVIHRSTTRLPEGTPPVVMQLIAAMREIEDLVDYDALDIEFAVRATNDIHILQVRPMTVRHERPPAADRRTEQFVRSAIDQFEQLAAPAPGVCGSRTVWGCMPDWNPAEMIGIRPGRLAADLYRSLITDEVWATQRAEFGYRDVRPTPLMRPFAGQPYVDVRASFNSFVPAVVPDETAKRLVDYYVARLRAQPELHDKVEFEIVPTCYDFDFARWRQPLGGDAGLGAGEIDALRAGLHAITHTAIRRYQHELDAGEGLTRRCDALKAIEMPRLERAARLLSDCRRYGTLPFAHLARCGFIAMTLLRSAVQRAAVSEDRLGEFLASLHTVGQSLTDDAERVRTGTLEWNAFVDRYGHLRPGTYDITSPPYSRLPARYLAPLVAQASRPQPAAFQWTAKERAALEALLAEARIDATLEQFERFLRRSIEGRESSKFLFSRNLSLALEDIAAFGEAIRMTREELADLDLADLSAVASGVVPSSEAGPWLKDRAQSARDLRVAAQTVELPPLLCDTGDFWGFLYPHTEPNYVTSGRVTAPCVDLDSGPADGELSGKIILIDRADPGYDWLFGHGIAGLITVFGGANSHMAIRAAEFRLPSAIGIGHGRYNKLAGARMIDLNCRARQLVVVA